MSVFQVACARCAQSNHSANRFCELCGLPLGRAEADTSISFEAIDIYEAPDPGDGSAEEGLRALLERCESAVAPAGRGYRLLVELPQGRRQAVYVGHAGTDGDDRPLICLLSVCGTASERDFLSLLKINARMLEGHFAVWTLRGEDYIVVVQNVRADQVPRLDVERLVRRVAETADRLEEKLSRGRDLY